MVMWCVWNWKAQWTYFNCFIIIIIIILTRSEWESSAVQRFVIWYLQFSMNFIKRKVFSSSSNLERLITGNLWRMWSLSCNLILWPFSPDSVTIVWCDFKACSSWQELVNFDTWLSYLMECCTMAVLNKMSPKGWVFDYWNPWNISKGNGRQWL